jgi:hypothetical protein
VGGRDFGQQIQNPYSPKLDPQIGRYSASTLPARPFLDAVRAGTKSPCTDIVLEGTGALEGWLRAVV